jgi:vesicle-associated membrane protein 7
MAEESVDRRVPFALLDDLKRELTNRYSLSSLGKSAYELQSDFGPILEDKMTSYSSDTLSRIQSEVTDLRKITVSTVDKLLERGTRLELLVTKTNDMSESAFAFKREAGRIQRHMYWKRVKMGVGIGGVVVVGFYGLVSMICSPTLHC